MQLIQNINSGKSSRIKHVRFDLLMLNPLEIAQKKTYANVLIQYGFHFDQMIRITLDKMFFLGIGNQAKSNVISKRTWYMCFTTNRVTWHKLQTNIAVKWCRKIVCKAHIINNKRCLVYRDSANTHTQIWKEVSGSRCFRIILKISISSMPSVSF